MQPFLSLGYIFYLLVSTVAGFLKTVVTPPFLLFYLFCAFLHCIHVIYCFLILLFISSPPLRALNKTDIESLEIKMLPGYKDPYHGRPLTKGELGCFLSHYNIWKEVRHFDRVCLYMVDNIYCTVKQLQWVT